MTMDINGIQSIYSASNIASLASKSAQDGSAATGDVSSAASVNLSAPGQVWNQLQNLSQTDPSQFKEVAADIASKLTDLASSMTGKQADFVNQLADRFKAASQSGKMSDLAPPSSGQQSHVHHGHHHHHAQGTGASSQSSDGTQSKNNSVFDQIQSIISNALSTATGTST